MIELQNVTKRYGRKVAVADVSFAIEDGGICGLLGPNGAGKTTLLSMMTTLLFPTEGNILVGGKDTRLQGGGVREQIGVVFQEIVLNDELTAYQTLRSHALLYHLDKIEERIDEVLKRVDLLHVKNDKIGTFSGGMKRRIELARGMLGNPEVLILDEPTLGLDPIARNNVWVYIKKLNKQGMTVVIATNSMEEAERLCSDIIIMHNGKLIIHEKSLKLKKKYRTLEKAFLRLTS